MPTRFITLFEGRTGSSYFTSCLASLPHIDSVGELLIDLDAPRQRACVEEFFTRQRPAAITAVGFKTKLRDVEDVPAFRTQLDALDVRVIHMIRTNKVKLALSRLNARRLHRETGTWNRHEGMPALAPFAPTFNEFDAALRFREAREEALEAFIAGLRRPLLTIRYEEMLADEAGMFARVFAFIGAKPGPMGSTIAKNTSDNLRQALTNYDELRACYAGTEYEGMFDA